MTIWVRRTLSEEIIMTDYTIYALKGDVDAGMRAAVYSSLTQGEGRFGWSYIKDANLHDLGARSKTTASIASRMRRRTAIRAFYLNSKRMITLFMSTFRSGVDARLRA